MHDRPSALGNWARRGPLCLRALVCSALPCSSVVCVRCCCRSCSPCPSLPPLPIPPYPPPSHPPTPTGTRWTWLDACPRRPTPTALPACRRRRRRTCSAWRAPSCLPLHGEPPPLPPPSRTPTHMPTLVGRFLHAICCPRIPVCWAPVSWCTVKGATVMDPFPLPLPSCIAGCTSPAAARLACPRCPPTLVRGSALDRPTRAPTWHLRTRPLDCCSGP
jgi:hypothetical protein